jgi:hypothetical protein
MDHSQEYLDEIGSKKFYISIVPNKKGLERFGKSDLDRKGVFEYIDKNIGSEDFENYNFILQEYYPNRFGGSIVIGTEKKRFYSGTKKKNDERDSQRICYAGIYNNSRSKRCVSFSEKLRRSGRKKADIHGYSINSP